MKRLIIITLIFIPGICASQTDTTKIFRLDSDHPTFTAAVTDESFYPRVYTHLQISPVWTKEANERKCIRSLLEFGCPSITLINYDRWAAFRRTHVCDKCKKVIEVSVTFKDGTTKEYTFEEFKKYLWDEN